MNGNLREVEIVSMYEQNVSRSDIKREYGITDSTLYAMLKRHNVPVRRSHSRAPTVTSEPLERWRFEFVGEIEVDAPDFQAAIAMVPDGGKVLEIRRLDDARVSTGHRSID